MAREKHDWLTLHRVRFGSAISALDRQFEAPDLPNVWRFNPSLALGDTGLPTWQSEIWGGLGIYDDRDDAELMVSQPSAQLPYLSEAVEEWHALLLPFKHHGSVKWTESIVTNSAIQISSDAPDGPLVVVTTAGFDSREPAQHPRISGFLRGVLEVLDYFGTLDGNLRRASYAGGYDQREGFTASIWQNEAAMMQAAYWAGTHRTLMDRSRDGSMFDRSSFTRARLVHSNGSWDGDPLAD